jgi:hypothetical protein
MTDKRRYRVSFPRRRKVTTPGAVGEATQHPRGGSAAIRLENCVNGTVKDCQGWGVDTLIDAENCANMTYEGNVTHGSDPVPRA